MTDAADGPLDRLAIDHIGFAVRDLAEAAEPFTDRYGLTVLARSPGPPEADVHALTVGTDRIRCVLTSADHADHPVARYVERHGDGICDIALRTSDAAAAFHEAVRRGAAPLAGPVERDGVVTASVVGFGDVAHTFVQRPEGSNPALLPGLSPVPGRPGHPDPGLHEVDHLAVCLEPGRLGPTVEYYVRALGFAAVFTERIVVGAQAMDSIVVQNPAGTVTLTLIEPDTTREPGQIDRFLRAHGGAGVQHLAFSSDDIVRSVRLLASRGVAFLDTPSTYYDLIPGRLTLARHSVEELRDLGILADADQDGQLLQIFTRSAHPRGTLFFEVIERLGARTFGSGNIKALYEAVELQANRSGAAR
ncbi:4-hydroxyphenylpyruvate dioxygenase [Streptomyces sp. NPDC048506]|uniref:4-hydroxyphenylpyruvate dioxygenase n=1 Tax=Streptomyces sp. NPDC048506 TaxID=3155028 RepID=UPI003431619E